tara:strand:- start:128 stop:445 length:318 start_codon:yes stop_codon:yes gene_type:complete
MFAEDMSLQLTNPAHVHALLAAAKTQPVKLATDACTCVRAMRERVVLKSEMRDLFLPLIQQSAPKLGFATFVVWALLALVACVDLSKVLVIHFFLYSASAVRNSS